MKTRHKYTLQFSDTDASRRIPMNFVERYLLEAGGLSAMEMGIGTDHLLKKYDCAWVLTRMTIEMYYLPTYLENIIFETWVEQNSHLLSIRNYNIYIEKDGKETLIGRSVSVWTILNLTTRALDGKCFSDPQWESIIDGEHLEFSRAPRLGKIEEPTSVMQHTVHYSDLDYNQHCNSCKYTQFMLNACDKLAGVAPIRFDVNHAKEVHKGENISVQVKEKENEIQYCVLTEQGEVSCTGIMTVITPRP